VLEVIKSGVMASRKSMFEEVLRAAPVKLEPELAKFLLGLQFSDAQKAQYKRLAYKIQEKPLSPKEQAELDAFLEMETFLIVLKAKARRSLKLRPSAA
jgi:hypothetical protein